jgi:hypothetical protein
MLFCKIFVVVIIYTFKNENQNSTINNFFGLTFTLRAQKNEYSTASISDSLKESANAIVRLNQLMLLFFSTKYVSILKKVITVLNEKDSAIDAIENYNKKTTVRDIEASVYDSFGNEIKRGTK